MCLPSGEDCSRPDRPVAGPRTWPAKHRSLHAVIKDEIGARSPFPPGCFPFKTIPVQGPEKSKHAIVDCFRTSIDKSLIRPLNRKFNLFKKYTVAACAALPSVVGWFPLFSKHEMLAKRNAIQMIEAVAIITLLLCNYAALTIEKCSVTVIEAELSTTS